MATLLLVEDNAWIRSLMTELLVLEGHEVFEAADMDDALAVAQSHPGEIHLLVTDIILPGAGGRELAEKFRAVRPQADVLFVSGHARQQALDEGLLSRDAVFLQKPFDPEELAARVREMLETQ